MENQDRRHVAAAATGRIAFIVGSHQGVGLVILLQVMWLQALLVNDLPDNRQGTPSTAAILFVLVAGLL
jgi:hypothetical protein